MHLKLAWRNIWRNPRRTAIMLAAIVIGVWAMIFLGALMRGMADGMVKNAIATLTGHLQIQDSDYRRDPAIDNAMMGGEALLPAIRAALPPDARVSARIHVPAMANNARHSGGISLVGVDPAAEAAVSFIGPEAIAAGRYLTAGDGNVAVVGEKLLDTFQTRIGNKLVITSQDTEGGIAAAAFVIVGAYRAELSETEERFVFVNKPAAREMLKLHRGVSEIAVMLADRTHADVAAERLRAAVSSGAAGPEKVVVYTWKELLPAISGYMEIFDGFMYLWYVIIFIAMGFGVVNTLLMAVFERMREFGLLRALGMKPLWIARGVLTESFLLLATGALAGDLIAVAGVRLVAATGIDLSAFAQGAEFSGIGRIVYPALEAGDFIAANLIVMGLGLIISLYPAAKAARIAPAAAMARA